MGALSLNYENEKYTEIYECLTEDTDFWIKNDIWKGNDKAFNAPATMDGYYEAEINHNMMNIS